MGEILAGAGVIVMLAIVALMTLVVKFAFVIVPILVVATALTLIPERTWAQFRAPFGAPVPIRVRSPR